MSKPSIYLIANYFIRPRSARTPTQIKGWMNDSDNVSYDEQVAVARRLKTRDLTTSKIILDLVNKKIVKNGWQTETTFDQLFGYFLKNYPQYVAGPMAQLDPDYLTSFNKTATVETEAVADNSSTGSASISSSISSAG